MKSLLSAILLLASFIGYSQNSLTNNLVASFSFDGNAINTINNTSAKVVGASLTSDRHGKPNAAYQFDGNNDYIELTSGLPEISGAYTISCWVFKPGTWENEYQKLIFLGINNKRFRIVLSQGNSKFPFYFYPNGVVGPSRVDASRPPAGRWVNLILTYDGSSNAKLYIDGNLASQKNYQMTPAQLSTNFSNMPFRIGWAYGGEFFKGSIDDILIYNRTLSSKEVKQLSSLSLDQLSDNEAPQLTITSPQLSRGFKPVVPKASVDIQGTVSDNQGIKSLTINAMPTPVNVEGYFSKTFELAPGDNNFEVIATDVNGNIARKSFLVNFNKESTTVAPPTQQLTADFMGNYHALIIGVQDYADPAITDLDNPAKDAKSLMAVLSSQYTFKTQNTKYLENPSMQKLTQTLENYYNTLSEQDNLLIFYAGHGYWDEKFAQGYWLLSDAQKNNRGTWLSNSTLRDYIRAIPTKHTLLITDACFGGGIFKSRNAFANASVAIQELNKLPSRKAMTSGALSEVPDNSVFIEYLVKRLNHNDQEFLSAEQLFANFKMAVINNSTNSQVPQFGEIKQTGDEGGDFIFIKKAINPGGY